MRPANPHQDAGKCARQVGSSSPALCDYPIVSIALKIPHVDAFGQLYASHMPSQVPVTLVGLEFPSDNGRSSSSTVTALTLVPLLYVRI